MHELRNWIGVLLCVIAVAAPHAGLAAERQHLFIIERSTNANTVFYDLRLNADGTPPRKNPVDAYWMRYASNGERMELRWFEEKMAYGVKIKSDVSATGFDMRLKAFDERMISVREVDGVYQPIIEIDGAPAYLRKVKVTTSEGGLIPMVHYIELFGDAPKSGSEVYEKVAND
jgi:hypothetical protein